MTSIKPQPTAEGASLERWVFQFVESDLDNPDSPESKQAADALRAIGNEGIPYLLKWMNVESSSWRRQLDNAVSKLPHSSQLSAMIEKPGIRANFSVHAFRALREQGSNAIPTLIQFLTNTNKPETAMGASMVLGYIGKPAVPALVEMLGNAQLPNRDLAAHALACMDDVGTNATVAVPVLLCLSTASDSDLANTAVLALGHIALDPDRVVPVLIKRLTSPYFEDRFRAALALSSFHESAKSAIPDLLSRRPGAEPEEREVIDYALTQIAPQSPCQSQ
jgi:HEAT repeat protein